MTKRKIHLVVKRLTASDLGWFSECRRRGTASGNQRGINIDINIMKEIFPKEMIDEGKIFVYASYKISHTRSVRDEPRPIRYQAKNWRLTGRKIAGERFGNLKPGDFMMIVIFKQDKWWKLRWEVVGSTEEVTGYRMLDKLVQQTRIWSMDEGFLGLLSITGYLMPELMVEISEIEADD
jgi:hypothetical protein